MIKRLLSLAPVAVCIALSGCTLTPPGSHEELCNNLRSQALYNTINHNVEATWTTQTQKNEFAAQMKQNNC